MLSISQDQTIGAWCRDLCPCLVRVWPMCLPSPATASREYNDLSQPSHRRQLRMRLMHLAKGSALFFFFVMTNECKTILESLGPALNITAGLPFPDASTALSGKDLPQISLLLVDSSSMNVAGSICTGVPLPPGLVRTSWLEQQSPAAGRLG